MCLSPPSSQTALPTRGRLRGQLLAAPWGCGFAYAGLRVVPKRSSLPMPRRFISHHAFPLQHRTHTTMPLQCDMTSRARCAVVQRIVYIAAAAVVAADSSRPLCAIEHAVIVTVPVDIGKTSRADFCARRPRDERRPCRNAHHPTAARLCGDEERDSSGRLKDDEVLTVAVERDSE